MRFALVATRSPRAIRRPKPVSAAAGSAAQLEQQQEGNRAEHSPRAARIQEARPATREGVAHPETTQMTGNEAGDPNAATAGHTQATTAPPSENARRAANSAPWLNTNPSPWRIEAADAARVNIPQTGEMVSVLVPMEEQLLGTDLSDAMDMASDEIALDSYARSLLDTTEELANTTEEDKEQTKVPPKKRRRRDKRE